MLHRVRGVYALAVARAEFQTPESSPQTGTGVGTGGAGSATAPPSLVAPEQCSPNFINVTSRVMVMTIFVRLGEEEVCRNGTYKLQKYRGAVV